jgi:hypothetical protein
VSAPSVARAAATQVRLINSFRSTVKAQPIDRRAWRSTRGRVPAVDRIAGAELRRRGILHASPQICLDKANLPNSLEACVNYTDQARRPFTLTSQGVAAPAEGGLNAATVIAACVGHCQPESLLRSARPHPAAGI